MKEIPGSLFTHANKMLNWFQDDVFRRLFLNAGRLLSAHGIAALAGFVASAMSARALGPENFGVFALVLTYVATVGRLVTFNAWQAIIKFGSEVQHIEGQDDLKKLLKFGFGLDLASAIVGTILAMTLSSLAISVLGWDESIRALLVAYSSLILFSLNGTPIAVLRLYDRFDLLSYTALVSGLLRLAGVAWCFFIRAELFWFLLAYLLSAIIGQLYQVLASAWVLKGQGVGDFAFVPVRGLRDKFPGIFDYVWTTNIYSTIRMLSRESDELIIAGLTTPSALGLYKVAKQFSRVLPMLTDPLYQSIYPELARLRAADKLVEFRSMIKRSTLIVGIIALGAWLLFLVTGNQIISWTVGQEYREAYWLAVWYMLALVIAIVTFSFTPSMLALGLPRVSLKILMAATTVYLIILWPFIEKWGIIGAPLSYLLFYVFWSTLTYMSLRTHLKQATHSVSTTK